MLITPFILYALVASFGLRFYYHNRLMTVTGEAQEARKGTMRRRLALGLVVLSFLVFDADIPCYVSWFSTHFVWWKFTVSVLALAVLWVAKEATYKTEVLWHHYTPPPGVQMPQMHRPRLVTSLCMNLMFWSIFLVTPWLPFGHCLKQVLLQSS